ncbi:MAG: hypothetical protein H7039_23210 [Bryobacteraceae bacterium]|nr:hypothetical protein [Bryobacteraceae bacterium]
MHASLNLFGFKLGIKIDSRSKRRSVVAATVITYVATCVFAVDARTSSGLLLAVDLAFAALAGLGLVGCWLALVSLTRQYGFPGDLRLFTSRDERQSGVRHHAFVRGYMILTALVCSGVVYWMAPPEIGLPLPDPAYRGPLLFGLIVFCTLLPTAIIAWTEPDDSQEMPARSVRAPGL